MQESDSMVGRCRTSYVHFMGSPSSGCDITDYMVKFKEFCKPQSNAVCAWFDLVTSFRFIAKTVKDGHRLSAVPSCNGMTDG